MIGAIVTVALGLFVLMALVGLLLFDPWTIEVGPSEDRN